MRRHASLADLCLERHLESNKAGPVQSGLRVKLIDTWNDTFRGVSGGAAFRHLT